MDKEFSDALILRSGVFRDSLIIFEILSEVSGVSMAILSIKFLNSLILPGQS